MGNLGTPEILLILLVVLVLFGAKKIPELAQGLGKGIREFRRASSEIRGEIENEFQNGSSRRMASCYACGSSVPDGAKFCTSCGKSLGKKTCSGCGAMNEPANNFCSSCGVSLPS